MKPFLELARLGDAGRFGFVNAGWAYDAYPNLETLDAGKTMTVAALDGPGVITHFHTTIHHLPNAVSGEVYLPASTRAALCARGVVLEVYYNGMDQPAVSVPLADFFADGCAGRARHFSSPWIEKAPECYNCYIPMPFERCALVVLRNETPFNLTNYSYVEYDRLPEWDAGLGYFHASWRRWAFPLSRETDERFFLAGGRGHLIGRNWSVATDEDLFAAFHFVMEGNNEVRIDAESAPRADYLGSEDSFGFSWGWTTPFQGQWSGINYLQARDPAMLSVYRFHGTQPIPFNKSLEWRVNWKHELRDNPWLEKLASRVAKGGGWVDYAATHYWYQEEPGHDHFELPDLDSRIKPVLRANPVTEDL